jgi:hypothetical protein
MTDDLKLTFLSAAACDHPGLLAHPEPLMSKYKYGKVIDQAQEEGP